MRLRSQLIALFVAAMAVVPARRADAAFHLMSIVEFFPGTAANPNAQYVVLQMYNMGQTFVGGHSIIISNASNNVVNTYTLVGNVTTGANQSRILIATAEAQALFGITADFTLTGAGMPLAGGKICFDSIDCVTYGSHPGANASDSPFSPTGLVLGRAGVRRLDIAPTGGATTLEAADDTGNSANDFFLGAPVPINNVGTVLCGDGTKTAGEECDDGNRTSGDGCDARCGDEVCGNGVKAATEQCDDGNQVLNDGCTPACLLERCGDLVVNGTEACDDGNLSNLDACLNTCVAARCGDSFTQTGVEQCDDGNAVNTDACLDTCVAASCGDGFVRAGTENCDDGPNNDMNGFCNATCTGQTGSICGNGIVEPGETCDTTTESATCDGDCTTATCGDTHVNGAAGETCDEGANNGMPNRCAANCMGLTPSDCGNGVIENAEACDDGAANGMIDRCASDCSGLTPATCGNGLVEWSETCDESTQNGRPNQCNATCDGYTAAICGNGILELGEQCDEGASNGAPRVACSSGCLDIAATTGEGGCNVATGRGTEGGARDATLLALSAVLVVYARRRSRR